MKVFRERAGERDELEERSSQIECKVFSKLYSVENFRFNIVFYECLDYGLCVDCM
jgi:hypothetical protein